MPKNDLNIIRHVWARIAPRFESGDSLFLPLWRDWSKHNGFVDHRISATNGVCGMASRAGISWGYRDEFFNHNWVGAALFGMYRTSYHVLYPGQNALAQADNWYAVHPEIDVIPRVIDLEVDDGSPASKVAQTTWQMSNIVLERDGVRPIIYTRYLLANSWLASWTDEMLNEHYWWLAQYLFDRAREHPGPPTLPNRVNRENVILHQTADKKLGYPGECQSAAADYDRWQGDIVQMHKFIEDTWGDSNGGNGGPVDPPIQVEELSYAMEGNRLHIQMDLGVKDE